MKIHGEEGVLRSCFLASFLDAQAKVFAEVAIAGFDKFRGVESPRELPEAAAKQAEWVAGSHILMVAVVFSKKRTSIRRRRRFMTTTTTTTTTHRLLRHRPQVASVRQRVGSTSTKRDCTQRATTGHWKRKADLGG